MTDLERALEQKRKEISTLKAKLKDLDDKISSLNPNTPVAAENKKSGKDSAGTSSLSSIISLSPGKKLIGIRYNSRNYECQEGDIMFEIVKILDEEQPLLLEDLALSDFCDSEGAVIITFDSSSLKSPKEIRDGIFIETGIDFNRRKEVLDSLLEEYQTKDSEFQVVIQDQ